MRINGRVLLPKVTQNWCTSDFYNNYVFQQSQLPLSQYFEENSSFTRLHKITIPCYILLAMDDAMVDDKFYPYEQARTNPNLILHVTEEGGHVGYTDFQSEYFWSEALMSDFVKRDRKSVV